MVEAQSKFDRLKDLGDKTLLKAANMPQNDPQADDDEQRINYVLADAINYYKQCLLISCPPPTNI